MKVDDTYQSANLIDRAKETGAGQRNEAQGAHKAGTEAHRKSGGDTEVALSSTSREIMKAGEAMEASDPERAEKVAALKEQVAEGTYEADPQEVADRILAAALSELL